MPRVAKGWERIDLQVPAAVARECEREAAAAGVSVSAWVGGLVASRVGLPYSPPPRGRPKKLADPPAKPKGKGKGRGGRAS